MEIKFKKLNPQAVLPQYAKAGDAGFDLFSCEDFSLKPLERHVFNLGLASEIPENYYVKVSPKSGLAVKAGIDVMAGTIDSSYRGEWGVVLINLGNEPYEFKAGDKLAQGVLLKVEGAEIVETDNLSETDRGTGGFGSTGK